MRGMRNVGLLGMVRNVNRFLASGIGMKLSFALINV